MTCRRRVVPPRGEEIGLGLRGRICVWSITPDAVKTRSWG